MLSEYIAKARVVGRPLSELLVENRVISGEQLSHTLFEHSSASLEHVVSHRVHSVRRGPRPTGDFSSRYAFEALPFVVELARRVFGPGEVPSPAPAGSQVTTALSVVRRDELLFPIAVSGTAPRALRAALELMLEGDEAMRALGRGVACFRRGERCWSIAGTADAFVVSEGESALTYSWMSMQSV
ncbi:MAG: hypothetical protein JNK82_15175 [Myxococcaceae bacterium]|nr:hypothetical protein [Myxococcaceae bacterium]